MPVSLNSNINPQIQQNQAAQLNQLAQLNTMSAQNAQNFYSTQGAYAQNAPYQSYTQGIGQNTKQNEAQISQTANLQQPLQEDTLNISPEMKTALQDISNNSALNARMPEPEIVDKNKTPGIETLGDGSKNELKNNNDENTYKELPHLNVGVVDGPSKHSKTPVTDSLNRKAVEIPKTKLPQATNKKSFNAGSFSNLCAFGALGIISFMFVPKGFSKILKLIKHK